MNEKLSTSEPRVDWVDAAKGLCIIFVVMMHSTLGVGIAMDQHGFMHTVVAWARPFRMPDFFLISGLFLGLVIDRPMRRYVDRKVVHFAYFYVLWLTIQFVFKAPGIASEQGITGAAAAYLMAFFEPFGTLWFIYILPIFFLFTRLVKTLPVWFVFVWAACLEALPIHTGTLVFDEFCSRYVYFLAGYAFAANIFRIAAWLQDNPGKALAFLAIWAPVEAFLVFTPPPEMLAGYLPVEIHYTGQTGGIAELPIVSLVTGLAGALAIVAIAALMTRFSRMQWLSWLGAHSIVVYLAFFLPMAISREVLVRSGLIGDPGWVSVIVTIAGVSGPVVAWFIVQWTGYGRFLFERPRWASIDRPQIRTQDKQPVGGH